MAKNKATGPIKGATGPLKDTLDQAFALNELEATLEKALNTKGLPKESMQLLQLFKDKLDAGELTSIDRIEDVTEKINRVMELSGSKAPAGKSGPQIKTRSHSADMGDSGKARSSTIAVGDSGLLGAQGAAAESIGTAEASGAVQGRIFNRYSDELGDLLTVEGKGGKSASKVIFNKIRDSKDTKLLLGYLEQIQSTSHTLPPEVWATVNQNIDGIVDAYTNEPDKLLKQTFHNQIFKGVPPQYQEKVRETMVKALHQGVTDKRFGDSKLAGSTGYAYKLPDDIKDFEVDGKKGKKALDHQLKVVGRRAEVLATGGDLASTIDKSTTGAPAAGSPASGNASTKPPADPTDYLGGAKKLLKGAGQFALGGEEGMAAWSQLGKMKGGIPALSRAFLGTPAGLLGLAMAPSMMRDSSQDQYDVMEAAQPTAIERFAETRAREIRTRNAMREAMSDPAAMAALQMQAKILDERDAGPPPVPGRVQFSSSGGLF